MPFHGYGQCEDDSLLTNGAESPRRWQEQDQNRGSAKKGPIDLSRFGVLTERGTWYFGIPKAGK